jgi:hypothetical protein
MRSVGSEGIRRLHGDEVAICNGNHKAGVTHRGRTPFGDGPAISVDMLRAIARLVGRLADLDPGLKFLCGSQCA